MDIDFKYLLSQRRFQPPENWDWGLATVENVKIRYGLPRSRKSYDGIVTIIGGLGDFGEQYFEFANELESRNLKPIIIDMPGQGGSSRFIPNQPMKRHSEGFDKALRQLHTVIENVVLSAAIDADDNHKRLPMILCAHSMGGNFALRYLAEYNKTSHNQPIFTCAAFTSPMFGIYAVNVVPPFVRIPLLKFLSLAPTAYVPNGCDWFDGYRERPGLKGIFSSDLERFALQRAYFTHPDYQFLVTGSPTNKWLRDALASCRTIQQKDYVENITTPVFIGIAGQDRLIQNSAIWDVVKRLKNGESLEIPESQHEILMERNPIRQQFVERFFTFIEENVLNKPDKGKTYIQ